MSNSVVVVITGDFGIMKSYNNACPAEPEPKIRVLQVHGFGSSSAYFL